MKCKMLKIESNGTSAGTKISVDGKQLGLVQRIEFSAESDVPFARILVEYGVHDENGKVKMKNVAGKEKMHVEPLVLEFVRD